MIVLTSSLDKKMGEKQMVVCSQTLTRIFRFLRTSPSPFRRISFLYLAILLTVASIYLMPHTSNAGSFTNDIKEKCPGEFELHKHTVAEFAIRMKPFVEACGCGVVNLYHALARNNMELLDQLEEDIEIMRAAVEVFSISEEFTDTLETFPDLLPTLVILARNDPDIFHKFSQVISSFSRHDSRQLRRNSSYILYYILASAMADKDTQSKKIESIARNLQKKVSVESVSALAMLYWHAMAVYPNAYPDYWMMAAEETLRSLGPKTVKILEPYKDFLSYFLPPTEDDIPESQNISAKEIQQLRQDYMDLIVYVFNEISGRYGTPYALMVIEYISPAVLEGLRFHRNKSEIKSYLAYEFRSENFKHVLHNGVCQSGSGNEGLKTFFVSYSPYDNAQPVRGTEGNLGLIGKWFTEGDLKQYIDQAADTNGYIYSMSLLPRIYFSLSDKQKRAFNDLLFGLSGDVTMNARMIIALNNTSRYFAWIENGPDAFLKIEHNPDVLLGESAPKYKHILLTSYPKDDSPSLFSSIGRASFSLAGLNHMMNMSVAELETHNFTDIEHYMAKAETAWEIVDWTVTVVSIAAIPFSAGASAAITSMNLSRKGAQTSAKMALKTLAKRTLKSTMKLVGKKGWKVAYREVKELAGKAPKRGRKAVREEAIKSWIYEGKDLKKKVGDVKDYVFSTKQANIITFVMAYFLANKPDSTEPSDLCEEIGKLSKRD